MSVREPRTARAEETKRRILAAAAVTVVDVGYSRLTFARVGRTGGVSAGAVYRYFRDKVGLVTSLAKDLESAQRRLLDEAEQTLGQARSTAEAVRTIVDAVIRAESVDPKLARVLREQAPRVQLEASSLTEVGVERLVRAVLAKPPARPARNGSLAGFVVTRTLRHLTQELLCAPRGVRPALRHEIEELLLKYVEAW